jgi:hypothetical protein
MEGGNEEELVKRVMNCICNTFILNGDPKGWISFFSRDGKTAREYIDYKEPRTNMSIVDVAINSSDLADIERLADIGGKGNWKGINAKFGLIKENYVDKIKKYKYPDCPFKEIKYIENVDHMLYRIQENVAIDTFEGKSYEEKIEILCLEKQKVQEMKGRCKPILHNYNIDEYATNKLYWVERAEQMMNTSTYRRSRYRIGHMEKLI